MALAEKNFIYNFIFFTPKGLISQDETCLGHIPLALPASRAQTAPVRKWPRVPIRPPQNLHKRRQAARRRPGDQGRGDDAGSLPSWNATPPNVSTGPPNYGAATGAGAEAPTSTPRAACRCLAPPVHREKEEARKAKSHLAELG